MDRCYNCSGPFTGVKYYESHSGRYKCGYCFTPYCEKCSDETGLITFGEGKYQKILCSYCFQNKLNDGEYMIMRKKY